MFFGGQDYFCLLFVVLRVDVILAFRVLVLMYYVLGIGIVDFRRLYGLLGTLCCREQYFDYFFMYIEIGKCKF